MIPEPRLLTAHRNCEWCGEAMTARFGQRYCSAFCRTEAKNSERRAQYRAWLAAGRPSENEIEQRANAEEQRAT
jgi:predicted nucleic acid-binding Zn ribbon protein